jgi:hypothetical protein
VSHGDPIAEQGPSDFYMAGTTFLSTMALFAGGTGLVMRFEIVAAVYSADTKFYSKNVLTYVSEVRVFLKQNEGIF